MRSTKTLTVLFAALAGLGLLQPEAQSALRRGEKPRKTPLSLRSPEKQLSHYTRLFRQWKEEIDTAPGYARAHEATVGYGLVAGAALKAGVYRETVQGRRGGGLLLSLGVSCCETFMATGQVGTATFVGPSGEGKTIPSVIKGKRDQIGVVTKALGTGEQGQTMHEKGYGPLGVDTSSAGGAERYRRFNLALGIPGLHLKTKRLRLVEKGIELADAAQAAAEAAGGQVDEAALAKVIAMHDRIRKEGRAAKQPRAGDLENRFGRSFFAPR
jgi:hypothetical protein